MKKRILSLALALIMCVSFVPAALAVTTSAGYAAEKVEGVSTFGNHYFQNGLIPVQVPGTSPDGYPINQWTYLNTSGEIVDLVSDKNAFYVFDFSEGYAPFMTYDFKVGYMDTAGKVVIQPQFDPYDSYGVISVGRFIGGNALVYNAELGDWEQIDAKGNKVPRTLDPYGEDSAVISDVAGNAAGAVYETVTVDGEEMELAFVDGVAITYAVEDYENPENSYLYLVKQVESAPDQEEPAGNHYSDWAAPEIEAALAAGLVTESVTGDMTKQITRFQFAELIVNVAEKVTGREIAPAPADTFTDCQDIAVLKAYASGIVTGVSEDRFAPDSLTNREQIATMIARAISYMEEASGKDMTPNEGSIEKFTDQGQVSSWAAEGVGLLAANGIMNGTSDTTLSPKNPCTVEQSILLVLRVYENG